MEKQFEKLSAEIAAGNASISKKIDDLKVDFNKALTDKFNACKRQTEKVNIKVEQLDDKFNSHIEITRRVNNAIISGIPYKANENIGSIFKDLSSKIGFLSPPDARYYRFKNENDEKRPIVIIFPAEFYKDYFMVQYFKVAKTLVLGDITGFSNSKERVYIQHDLTPEQYRINKLALHYRKSGLIKQVRITHGYVTMKYQADSKLISFSTPEALEEDIKKLKAK